MGLSAMDPFIGLAERADISLDTFNKRIGKPLLAFPRMTADRTQFAQTGQASIQLTGFFITHRFQFLPIQTSLPSSHGMTGTPDTKKPME